MGRLIDADALIENLREIKTLYGVPMTMRDEQMIHWIIGHIKEQPTAYNVDAVVTELEKLKQHNKELSEGAYLEDDKSFYFCAYTNFARAIDIVRKGGVE